MSAELTEMNDPQLWICSSRKDTASRRHWISNVSCSSYSYSPRQITHYQPYLLHLSLILIIFGTVSTKTNCSNYQSFYIIILSLLCMMVCNAQWIQINNPLLPRSDNDMISASYNGSIFLIGGSPDDRQMTEYIISDNIILDHGVSVLPLYHYCTGQCYTQFENILRIERRGEIIVYDVELTDFITNSVSISTPNGISYGGANCLLSNDVYLLMIGGFVTGKGTVDTVQVFILDENIWFNGTSMPQNRLNHGCILTSDFVYIIGGFKVNSVDKIALDYIQTESWTHIGTLSNALESSGCVLYDKYNLIYVIGGMDPSQIAQDNIYTVNIIDDIVTLTADRLPYSVYSATTVIDNDVIYVFGGIINYTGNVIIKTNTWIKYEISTTSPTIKPSRFPTIDPSSLPSISPTRNPTINPTTSPTKNPSRFPTLSPFVLTNNPSGTPIKNKNEATLSVNGHTYAPTVSPWPEYERTTTTTDQENTDDSEDDVDKTNVNQGLLLLIILLSVIIAACCGITSFVYLNRNRILTTIAKYTRSRAADDNNNNNINNDNVNPMCVERAASVSFDMNISAPLANCLVISQDNDDVTIGAMKEDKIALGKRPTNKMGEIESSLSKESMTNVNEEGNYFAIKQRVNSTTVDVNDRRQSESIIPGVGDMKCVYNDEGVHNDDEIDIEKCARSEVTATNDDDDDDDDNKTIQSVRK